MRTLPPLDEDLDPEEVIAVLTPLLGAERAARLDAVAGGRLEGVAAVLEDLHDPHNTGAALRSCEAMGVFHVFVVNVRERFRTSVRVTQGCERWLEVKRHRSVDDMVAAAQARGFRIYAAVPGAKLSLADIDPRERVALAFGNEHVGLSPGLRARADGEFSIPMYGASQSLNVSVSVAVALHVASEARRRAVGATTDLDAATLLRLRARYYAADVRGFRAVLARARAEKAS